MLLLMDPKQNGPAFEANEHRYIFCFFFFFFLFQKPAAIKRVWTKQGGRGLGGFRGRLCTCLESFNSELEFARVVRSQQTGGSAQQRLFTPLPLSPVEITATASHAQTECGEIHLKNQFHGAGAEYLKAAANPLEVASKPLAVSFQSIHLTANQIFTMNNNHQSESLWEWNKAAAFGHDSSCIIQNPWGIHTKKNCNHDSVHECLDFVNAYNVESTAS